MYTTSMYIVPHPPLILPQIGQGEELKVQKTLAAYRTIAKEIVGAKPDVVIISTPHAVSYADYIHIAPGSGAEGDFAQFGEPDVKMAVRYDEALTAAITDTCLENGFPAGTMGAKSPKLDHGFMVPWYFIREAGGGHIPCIRISISGLTASQHYQFGMLLHKTVRRAGKNAVYVASGDLSHKLKADGPYGFDDAGPVFDQKIQEIIQSGDFMPLFAFTDGERSSAGECGLRSLQIMTGALDGLRIKPTLLSYEGTFGVGYAVGRFLAESGEPEQTRMFLLRYEKEAKEHIEHIRSQESPYVTLARKSLASYLCGGEIEEKDLRALPEEMLYQRAGVFVSIKKEGQLRGCIGTIAPARQSIAEEIIMNAISAGTQDSRFEPVTLNELDWLVYSVDVLGAPERIDSPEKLDVKRYGVIVTAGSKRGLLLPNLEGIDTIEEQLSVAYKKGGIKPNEDVILERFEVVRYK